MDRAWVRSAAFGCVFATGALVVGPGIIGAAVAHAGLFGIGPDWIDVFGDDKKSSLHHPRPGEADIGAQASRSAVGAAGAEAGPPVAKIGSVPESASTSSVAENVSSARAAESGSRASFSESVHGDGRDAVPRSGWAGRSPNLPPVPSAPVTRSVVIRGVSPAAAPAFVAPAPPRAPVTVPLAAPPPSPLLPEGRPEPAAPRAPSPQAPHEKDPLAPEIPGAGRIPESFRAGYAEHLRAATTTDLLFAALPGVAGLVGFTVVGAYAGYRQARAVQEALLAPVPTRILL